MFVPSLFSILAIPTLIASFACKRPRPEFNSFKQSPSPVEVAASIKYHQPGNQDKNLNMANVFAGTLRDHLATFVTVVPESEVAPPDAVRLNVMIYEITYSGPRGLGQYLPDYNHRSDRPQPVTSFNWAGSENAYRISKMLGYYAPRIRGKLLLGHTKRPRSVYSADIPTLDIMRALKPFDDEVRDYKRSNEKEYVDHVHREISRAFAETITKQLQNEFDWQTKE